MPFGLVNSPATFSRIMRRMLRDVDSVHNYIDDILIHTCTWEEHVKVVKTVLKKLRSARLSARPTKCYFGYEQLEYLGHIVGHGKIKPIPEKTQLLQDAPRPETKTQLRSFLGLANYYRKFIPNFSEIAVPLTDRTKLGEPNRIRWEDSQERAFRTLKAKLSEEPILILPDLSKRFFLRTDASDVGIGAVLLQELENVRFPVAYASKKLLSRERAYAVIERECLAIVWGIKKFEPYLYGREFVVETDHQPLVHMQKAKVTNARIMRWALALQPYRFRIEAIRGSDNVGADYLSRV